MTYSEELLAMGEDREIGLENPWNGLATHWMGHVEGMAPGRPVLAREKCNWKPAEGIWTILADMDGNKRWIGHPWPTRTGLTTHLKIGCGCFWTSASSRLLPVSAVAELVAPGPRVTAPEMRRTSRLFAQDPRDVSWSFFLPNSQHRSRSTAFSSDCKAGRTIVTLGNPVLNSSALGKIWYLCPVLVWVCARAKGAAGIVCGRVLGRSCPGEGVLVAILTLHFYGCGYR
jgi:hypothetical protein